MLYDDIIVGVGSSGAVVAARLSEKRFNVRARAAGSPCAAPVLTTSRISNSNYLADSDDMRRMLDGMRLAGRIRHQPPVEAGWQGPIVGETTGQVLDQATATSDSALIDFIQNNCTTLSHPVGTTKMHS